MIGGTARSTRIVFQLTRSVWSATDPPTVTLPETPISTHALRVERDTYSLRAVNKYGISTHALRVERDFFHKYLQLLFCISTHALRVERDISATPLSE